MSEEKKVWPCPHIERGSIAFGSQWRDISTFSSPQQLSDKQMFCQYCGAQRPEERDSLQAILHNYFNRDVDISRIEKDIRDWASSEWADREFEKVEKKLAEEEKPKKLAEVIHEAWQKSTTGNHRDCANEEAKAAIEAVERVIDSIPWTPIASEIIEEIKQKLRSELL